MNNQNNSFTYMGQDGSFRLDNPCAIHQLYFPLCNPSGLMSSITPTLHGDMKTDQKHFIMTPVTMEDLHNTKSARNFWLYIHGKGPWSAVGNLSRQISLRFTSRDRQKRTIEAGPLWHKLSYCEDDTPFSCEIVSFIPIKTNVEIMLVRLFNNGTEAIEFTPTSAIPLFGRSAENIRDHRHVTALVNRVEKTNYGILVKPVIIFDERGHKTNHTMYYALGCEEDGTAPRGSIPSTHDFIGEAGSYEWPESVVRNYTPERFSGRNMDGQEYVGALRFRTIVLEPGEKKEYLLFTGVCTQRQTVDEIINKYGSVAKVYEALEKNKEFWTNEANRITFESGLPNFANWMRWVSLQPIFRKIYGCSFLPWHDYGKGGRGWRDLWQDCLSLILQNPSSVRRLLIDNFGGVRVDGTNATIIGPNPGEFIADRNNIARVWMDHGAWPYLTTRLYTDQSGDFKLLTEPQRYFHDGLINRATKKDDTWDEEIEQNLRCADGSIYTGTVIEHLLVQHLTCFFNVGVHNILRLEGGDWNDTLDMARENGESTAFTALYGSNLIGLADLIHLASKNLGSDHFEVFEELFTLLDTLSGCFNYESTEYKQNVLAHYLKDTGRGITGKRIPASVADLTADLIKKGQWIHKHIQESEYLTTRYNDNFFNGYYNNDGQRVDGDFAEGVRINLTAQVFTTMFGLANEAQVKACYQSCKKYLKDPVTGGYRLNTPLGPNQLNLGRGFAFAYGEKENGSVFCHMAVMYMNALYRRGFVKEAYELFKSLYSLANDTNTSEMYPGIPEYFNPDGKGMYTYLTGSASWLLLTVLTQMYGIRGDCGDLCIDPKLTAEQFDRLGEASARTSFRGKKITVMYINPNFLDFGQYRIGKVLINGQTQDNCIINGHFARIAGSWIKACNHKEIVFDVFLCS